MSVNLGYFRLKHRLHNLPGDVLTDNFRLLSIFEKKKVFCDSYFAKTNKNGVN